MSTTLTPMKFIMSHEAWYAKACEIELPEIFVGLYHDGGGTDGEFAFRWINLGSKLTPRLEAFDDSWKALAQFNERTDGAFLRGLAEFDGKDPLPEAIRDWLLALGFTDGTKREKGGA